MAASECVGHGISRRIATHFVATHLVATRFVVARAYPAFRLPQSF
jgi:hypothetical protein